MATKTAKQPVKKKGILSKINFRSRKTQFIASILVIAIAGAGYFTYQSFAATASWSYTVANGGLETPPKSSTLCSMSTQADASKNNTVVQVLGCGGNATQTLVSTRGGYVAKSQIPGSWRACFVVKGGGTNLRAFIYPPGAPTANVAASEIAKINANGYTTVCTAQTSIIRSEGMIYAQIGFGTSGKGIITISSISLEYFAGNAGVPAPAPVSVQK